MRANRRLPPCWIHCRRAVLHVKPWGTNMSNLLRGALACILLLALCGCVVTNAARLGSASASRPPVAADEVALYRVASQVPGPYEEVALLNSKGDSNFTDEARMFESMRKKAGQMGANGVILDALSEPGHGAKVAAAIFGVSAQRKGSAVAIWVYPAGTASAMQGQQVVFPNAVGVSPAVTPTSAAPAAPAAPQAAHSQTYERDPSKRCDACRRIGSP
jgi:hypothetical protein